MALARKTLDLCESRRNAGRATGADVQLAQQQCRLVEKLAKTAATEADDSEQRFRSLTGLAKQADPFVLSDAPTLASVRVDWDASLKEALENRPELILTRNKVWVWQGRGD